MALADIPTSGQRRRLDSWKEIAEYLGRDVRTATRWEAQGLPLHRVPGGKGTSVFAFSDEIDVWMAGRPAQPPAPAPAPASRSLRTVAFLAVIVAAVAGTAAWLYVQEPGLDTASLGVTATTTEVTLTDAAGGSRIVHRFAPGALPVPRAPVRLADLDRDGTTEVIVAVAAYNDLASRTIGPGEILSVGTEGTLRWRFAFDDVIRFGGEQNAGPWAIVDWQLDDARAANRIALAAHDYTWWPSIVAVIDSGGRRLGSFVNPGWMESVLWLPDGRLAAGGFNNLRDEAVLAVLDGDTFDGQAPGSSGTAFACLSCADVAPPFYATFARSEVNRVTAGRFNRAQVASLDGGILVTTSETGPDRGEVNALYEFDRDLRFVRARYSDRYWDEHRRLELEGRLTHARAACPERDGPAAIHAWSPKGWQRIPTPR